MTNKKQAGIFKLPFRLVETIYNWSVAQCLARQIYDLEISIEDAYEFMDHFQKRMDKKNNDQARKYYSKEIDNIQQKINAYQSLLNSKKSQSNNYRKVKPRLWKEVRKKFKFKLDDWEYADKLPDKNHEYTVTVRLLYNPHGLYKRRAGKWNGWKQILEIVTDAKDFDNLQETLKHEIRHFLQTILKYKTFGKPGKKLQNPEITQHGVSPFSIKENVDFKTKKHKALELAKKLRGTGISLHDIDDIEFYTVLADNINQFRPIQTVNKSLRSELINIYVGNKQNSDLLWTELHLRPSKFFSSLKQFSKPKWKKAVKEFFKAVVTKYF